MDNQKRLQKLHLLAREMETSKEEKTTFKPQVKLFISW